ncbi:potassium channel family protein [Smaragdicoccus niigatensis]|uniref:potassium channel family protein n=1 Tax=Smaragdicoccus niigatensis TaxID=359359 RepID=UPI001FDFB7EE|nr:TrkA family potassium uptake protein [Smaragdicoccus niigatensis]
MANSSQNRVAVLGLGRFGLSLCDELMKLGVEVLAVDSDPKIIQSVTNDVTHAAVADTTDPEAMSQLGIPDFEKAVVGIGTNIEASILTASVLVDFGIPKILAKAVSAQHARILERVGAHYVVRPEHDMGARVAHRITGRILDYIEFDPEYAMVKTIAPAAAVGNTLGESASRSNFSITVVAVKHRGGEYIYATESTMIEKGDVLIVGGKPQDVERFAQLPS